MIWCETEFRPREPGDFGPAHGWSSPVSNYRNSYLGKWLGQGGVCWWYWGMIVLEFGCVGGEWVLGWGIDRLPLNGPTPPLPQWTHHHAPSPTCPPCNDAFPSIIFSKFTFISFPGEETVRRRKGPGLRPSGEIPTGILGPRNEGFLFVFDRSCKKFVKRFVEERIYYSHLLSESRRNNWKLVKLDEVNETVLIKIMGTLVTSTRRQIICKIWRHKIIIE